MLLVQYATVRDNWSWYEFSHAFRWVIWPFVYGLGFAVGLGILRLVERTRWWQKL